MYRNGGTPLRKLSLGAFLIVGTSPRALTRLMAQPVAHLGCTGRAACGSWAANPHSSSLHKAT